MAILRIDNVKYWYDILGLEEEVVDGDDIALHLGNILTELVHRLGTLEEEVKELKEKTEWQ